MAIRTPNVFTIPPGIPFARAIATGLWHKYKHDLLALSDIELYLPNRRSCRALADYFLEVSDGRATLLPQLSPIGDIEEEEILFAEPYDMAAADRLAPAVAPLSRQMLLTQLILKRQDLNLSPAQAFCLARELESFLDRSYNEGIDLGQLPDLVIGDLATHWQHTTEFLTIITQFWPDILRQEGWMDRAERRNILLAEKCKALKQSPPKHPVMVVGSTGSIHATAQFMETIAYLPTGSVVLPGFDPDYPVNLWDAIDDPHPYRNLKNFLTRVKMEPRGVKIWPDLPPFNTLVTQPAPLAVAKTRRQLLHNAMQPQDVFDLGNANINMDGIGDFSFLVADNALHEARSIALILRETLDHPEQTALVVTPDRLLARAIQNEMQRWDVAVNDSGGEKLSERPLGHYCRLLMEVATSNIPATHLLSLLKHPLTCLNRPAGGLLALTQELEEDWLRADTPPLNIWQLPIPDEQQELKDFYHTVVSCLKPLLEQKTASLHDWVRLHVTTLEALAADNEKSGAQCIWHGQDGEALADLLRTILTDANGQQLSLSPFEYRELFHAFLDQVTIRPRFTTHPRLQILSPVEARLLDADHIILAGLNDGVWPSLPQHDPFLSRPMQAEMGFSLPERRIGQSALDFLYLSSLPRVTLSWAKERDGTKALPSRWLQQIFAVLEKNTGQPADLFNMHAHWARHWDDPQQLQPLDAPAPNPPLDARPRNLWVTEIGRLQQDPYAIYATRILGLRPWNDLDRAPDNRDWGNIVHKLAEKLTRHADATLEQLYSMTRSYGEELLRTLPLDPLQHERWQQKLELIGNWLAQDLHQTQRDVLAETRGTMEFPLPDGSSLSLSGRADRMMQTSDGLVISDYKTGTLPTEKEIDTGLAPQLPLLAWMAQSGSFKDLPPLPVDQIEYIHMRGRKNEPVTNKSYKRTAQLIELNQEHFRQLLQDFYQDLAPYQAIALPPDQYDSYMHLKRTAEWALLTDGVEDSE